jgi:hypothetical protein
MYPGRADMLCPFAIGRFGPTSRHVPMPPTADSQSSLQALTRASHRIY